MPIDWKRRWQLFARFHPYEEPVIYVLPLCRPVIGKAVEVVAALLWQGDRFLICQRPAHKARGLLWGVCGRQG